jgi:hypothetical protein
MAIAVQQNITAVIFNSATSQTANFAACQAVSLLVALGMHEDVSASMSASDDVNGTYTTDKFVNPGGSTGVGRGSSGIFSFQNRSTSSKTVTLTCGASTDGYLKIMELTGVAESSAVDVSDDDFCNTGAGAALSLSLTTTVDSCAILNCSTRYGSNGSAVDSGYTAGMTEAAANNSYEMVEYDIDVGAAGTKTLTYNSYSSTINHSAVAVAYKPAAGADAVGPIFMGS